MNNNVTELKPKLEKPPTDMVKWRQAVEDVCKIPVSELNDPNFPDGGLWNRVEKRYAELMVPKWRKAEHCKWPNNSGVWAVRGFDLKDSTRAAVVSIYCLDGMNLLSDMYGYNTDRDASLLRNINTLDQNLQWAFIGHVPGDNE